jgi:hypothetical protein
MPNDTTAVATALWTTPELISHLFLYPFGHLGFTAVIFFTVLPLTQMIELFFGVAFVVGDGAGSSLVLFACHCAL